MSANEQGGCKYRFSCNESYDTFIDTDIVQNDYAPDTNEITTRMKVYYIQALRSIINNILETQKHEKALGKNTSYAVVIKEHTIRIEIASVQLYVTTNYSLFRNHPVLTDPAIDFDHLKDIHPKYALLKLWYIKRLILERIASARNAPSICQTPAPEEIQDIESQTNKMLEDKEDADYEKNVAWGERLLAYLKSVFQKHQLIQKQRKKALAATQASDEPGGINPVDFRKT